MVKQASDFPLLGQALRKQPKEKEFLQLTVLAVQFMVTGPMWLRGTPWQQEHVTLRRLGSRVDQAGWMPV